MILAIKITSDCYMCRVTGITRVYTNPSDMKPSNHTILPGEMFVSDKQADIGSSVLFQISSPVSEDRVLSIPYDTWVSSAYLDYAPIEVIEDEYTELPSPKECHEYFVVKVNYNTFYENSQTSEGYSWPLTLGSIIEVDRYIENKSDTISNIRYHIKSIDGSIDAKEVGMWILGNPTFYRNETKYQDHEKNTLELIKEKDVPERVKFKTSNLNQSRSVGSSSRKSDITQSPLYTGNRETQSSQFSSSLVDDLGTPVVKKVAESAAAQSAKTQSKEDINSAGAAETSTDTDDSNSDVSNWSRPQEDLDEYAKITYSEVSDYRELYKKYNLTYMGENLMSIPIGRMIFVHGMPFQYTYLTDRRLNNNTIYTKEPTSYKVKSGEYDLYGRMFAGDIAANMPICSITPGTPVFLTNIKQSLFGVDSNASNKERGGWLPLLSGVTDFNIGDAIKSIIDQNDDKAYQYYSMEINTTEYFNFVNALCQTTARFMGLSKVKYRNKACTSFNWSTYNTAAEQDYSMFEEILGINDGVAFAFDPMSSISDTMNNSTKDSDLAGMINGISEKARELEFMLGTGGISLDIVNSSDYEAALASVSDGVLSGIRNPLSVIGTFISNATHGMNVRFPEMWSDSSISRSYDLDMKFITPYATQFCKWRYVIVPFLHLFCLAAPQSKDTIMNYSRPFLIKAYSRGYFNVEMGLIDTIQWKRYGEGDMISEDGIPTEIDVSISFHDLYQQLAISLFNGSEGSEHDITMNYQRIAVFFNNSGLMDMLGSLSGVNTNRFNLGEKLSLFASTAVGAFSAQGANVLSHISNRVRNSSVSKFLYGL